MDRWMDFKKYSASVGTQKKRRYLLITFTMLCWYNSEAKCDVARVGFMLRKFKNENLNYVLVGADCE